VWLHLIAKRVGELELELDLAAVTPGRLWPSGNPTPGLWVRQLEDVIRAGDRVRLALALPEGPGGAEPGGAAGLWVRPARPLLALPAASDAPGRTRRIQGR
jgi:hypothetical protein